MEQGREHHHITPLTYLILKSSMLTEMFPVGSYIQIVVSQISKEVKKMLHYSGHTHRAAAALERDCVDPT